MHTGTVGSFFGAGLTKSYKKGKLMTAEPSAEQPRHADMQGGAFVCPGCSKFFNHPPTFGIHKRFCQPAQLSEIYGGPSLIVTPQAHSQEASSVAGGSSTNDHRETESVGTPPSTASSAKLRKDGQPKRSGLREGQRRVPHTLYLKYQVALQFKAFEEMKMRGQITDPLQRTSDMFHGLSLSSIYKWKEQFKDLRKALTHETSGVRKKRDHSGMIINIQSHRARRFSLHRGRGVAFHAAEEVLYRIRITRRAARRAYELSNVGW